jgi:predicted nucleic acid-binding protein
MTADRAIYLDSSAIVKLVVSEKESAALRRYLRGRVPLVVSALARTEVARALLPLGPSAVQRGHDVLARLELIRVSDRILLVAGTLLPAEIRSLDAIHLATMRQLGASLRRLVTYDTRMSSAASQLGISAVAPGVAAEPEPDP